MPKKRAKKSSKPTNPYLVKIQLLLGLIFLFFASLLLGSIKLEHGNPKPQVQQFTVTDKINGTVKASKLFTREAKPTDLPQQVIIPQAQINVKITESQIKDGYWEVSDTTANHGIGSAYPGEKGNSVIFAHVRDGLFLNLKNVALGDQIYVLTKNKWYKYQVSEIKRVAPEEIAVVQPTKDERLTLFTCDGYQDEKRLIIVAKPVK